VDLWQPRCSAITVWGAPESPELALGTDELSTWAAARARLFLPVDEACGPSLAVISARAGSGHSRKDANVFLGAADFQLVAYGRARNLKIVTLEIPRRNQNGKVKIPDACQAHGVDWTGLFRMWRDEKASFVLP
jgi:hypothetical protein